MKPTSWVSAGYGVALGALFLGERVAGGGRERLVLSGGGGVLLGLALGWSLARTRRASGDWRTLERWRLGLFLLGALGVGLYFFQAEGAVRVLGAGWKQKLPLLRSALGVLFPVALTLSLLPLGWVELAVGGMARAPVLELGRVRSALRSGLGLAFALVFAFSSQYVATRMDVSWDLAYFRTARPGEATRGLVRGLQAPVEVTLFFPPANDVRQAVEQYLRELSRESPLLHIEVLDQAVEPGRARELGVGENGSVVFTRDARHERLKLPLDLGTARSALQRLDEEVFRRLREVSRPRRVLYLTAGHGERGLRAQAATALEGARPGLSRLEDWLRVLNVEVRPLGVAEGLGTDVPRDAAVVAMVGPEREPSPEELAALRRYVERGGRLWLALEPDGPGLDALLEPWGLRSSRVPLANEQRYLRWSHQRGDRAHLVTTGFSTHASVATLASLGGDASVVFSGATALEPLPPLPRGVSLDVAVKASPETFQDANRDFTPDADEPRRAWPLVVAWEKVRPGAAAARMVVMGDADVMTDDAPRGYGNAYLLVDTVLWLLGEEELAGVLSNEEDVPVQHTRRQDGVWFYSAVFLAPALVLGVGGLVTRRRSRRRAR
ncbi:Gldg family protein [Melittangium boletus]|uniref:ABC transporter n=1 Tax=Melittangium boletus DSM 14713 TaxID=1294270 RepID=A0A250IKG9_9BACT|nr:Gldg family protein [Melittangium boletus]ATB31647.1 ABC transporter [Melittangium boletus DSM 14713]